MARKKEKGDTEGFGWALAQELMGDVVLLSGWGARLCDQAVLWEAVSVCGGYIVVLVKALHTVKLIVDAAGDVLDVLHVGPDGDRKNIKQFLGDGGDMHTRASQ